jgi:hypothetical protein
VLKKIYRALNDRGVLVLGDWTHGLWLNPAKVEAFRKVIMGVGDERSFFQRILDVILQRRLAVRFTPMDINERDVKANLAQVSKVFLDDLDVDKLWDALMKTFNEVTKAEEKITNFWLQVFKLCVQRDTTSPIEFFEGHLPFEVLELFLKHIGFEIIAVKRFNRGLHTVIMASKSKDFKEKVELIYGG